MGLADALSAAAAAGAGFFAGLVFGVDGNVDPHIAAPAGALAFVVLYLTSARARRRPGSGS
jgi:hypothetical protein